MVIVKRSRKRTGSPRWWWTYINPVLVDRCHDGATGTVFLGGVGEAKEVEDEMHEQWPPRTGTGRPLFGPAD